MCQYTLKCCNSIDLMPACRRKFIGLPVCLQVTCSGLGRCRGSSHACKNSAQTGQVNSHLLQAQLLWDPYWSATGFAPKLMSEQAASVNRRLSESQVPLHSTQQCFARAEGRRHRRYSLCLLTSLSVDSLSSNSCDIDNRKGRNTPISSPWRRKPTTTA